MRLNRKIERTIKKNLYDYQKDIYIYVRTSTACTACDVDDDVYDEPYDPACNACGGSGYVYTESIKIVKGVVRKIFDYSHYDHFRGKYDRVSDSMVRITVLLEDVLTNVHDKTGSTYLDNADRVIIDNRTYSLRNNYKIDGLVCIAVLDEEKPRS